jgi:hypothetical protein
LPITVRTFSEVNPINMARGNLFAIQLKT